MFKVTGKVNVFPGASGWHWVGVSEELSQKILKKIPKGNWQWPPINVKLGKTEWSTALLPLGEGKRFIALMAKVRKAEGVMAGDEVTLEIFA